MKTYEQITNSTNFEPLNAAGRGTTGLLDDSQNNIPILAEDMLLLLMQPPHGRIAGESNLQHILAGAILTELVLDEAVLASVTFLGRTRITALPGRRPGDELLGLAWDYIAQKPRDAQRSIGILGKRLREPLMSRLLLRGEVHEIRLSALWVFPVVALTPGASTYRMQLVSSIRAALVDGTEPTKRTTALIGLLSASQTLPLLRWEIPWNPTSIRRAKNAEEGRWGLKPIVEPATRMAGLASSPDLAPHGRPIHLPPENDDDEGKHHD
ncbi:GOLPH3/VPS74 family protein [Arthrobacter flavus]|uniref:GPP34 family phosphoprotein n=1 Tax=Arthrobacter flavus TaxID=95172 RepID=A0ABW4Q465_9MICC